MHSIYLPHTGNKTNRGDCNKYRGRDALGGTAHRAKSLGGRCACDRLDTEYYNIIFCTYATGRIVTVVPGPTISLFLSLGTRRTNGHVSRDISRHGCRFGDDMSYTLSGMHIPGVSRVDAM